MHCPKVLRVSGSGWLVHVSTCVHIDNDSLHVVIHVSVS